MRKQIERETDPMHRSDHNSACPDPVSFKTGGLLADRSGEAKQANRARRGNRHAEIRHESAALAVEHPVADDEPAVRRDMQRRLEHIPTGETDAARQECIAERGHADGYMALRRARHRRLP
jgi:hypothetical protein